MKLIDILNMISKGELKEGTKIKIGREIYSWNTGFMNNAFEGEDDTYLDPMQCLSVEVELIEPDHFADVGKMATEKIEELDVLGIGESQNIDNLGLANSIVDLRNEIREIQHKLNEVIRRINNVR